MNILIAPVLGILGLIAAFVVFSLVMRYSDGTDQVKKIGDEIHKGAMKFMKTEYPYLLIFVAVLVVLVATFLTIQSAIAVVVGAACSSLAGFIGMYAATKANVRTATADWLLSIHTWHILYPYSVLNRDSRRYLPRSFYPDQRCQWWNSDHSRL